MTDADRLLAWFASGRLLRPTAGAPGTVHLARALVTLAGGRYTMDVQSGRVAAAIGRANHHVFVLADGLGMNLIDRLLEGSFLRTHVALELRSVFPSSTAPSLTSLATGLWPAEHSVPSWFVYLPEAGVHTIPLPFVDRFSGQSLEGARVQPEVLFPRNGIWGSIKRDALVLMPANISGSVYTRYVSGGKPVAPYESLAGAVDSVLDRVADASAQTFTYVYYSKVDTAAHVHGPGSAEVRAEVEALETELARLARMLNGRGRLVVSADHGGYDVDDAMKCALEPGDELLEMLVSPPAGEPVVPMFHVKPGLPDDFAALFRRRFGESWILLSVDEADELRLLGPVPLSSETRSRLGDYIALSSQGEALVYGPEKAIAAMRGYHGGLTPAEVRIPLIVA